MSQENVDLVERACRAFRQDVHDGDVGRQMSQFLDPEVEWTAREDPTPVRGREAALRSLREWFDAMQLVEFAPERFIDCGESVVVLTRVVARGRGSGAEVSDVLAATWTVREGKVVRYAEFSTEADALKAAGLSE